ncbi:unnamed protein product [Aphanomyces euteiches]
MAIEGVGRTRVKKWGEAIIEIVKNYLAKKSTDEFDDGVDWAIVDDLNEAPPVKRPHATIDLSGSGNNDNGKRKKQ